MIEDKLGFEEEKLSPVVVVTTGLLISLFVIGLIFQAIQLLL